jgi:inward rectifier potassium channel
VSRAPSTPLPAADPAAAPFLDRPAGGWLDPSGRSLVRAKGVHRHPLQDLYHSWLAARWGTVFAAFLLLFLTVNTLFGLAYLAVGAGIENARPGSFSDAFFFSVQTLSTIGYGKLVPVSLAANLLVTCEVIAGLLGVAMTTGLLFAKFSRPTARVVWSSSILLAPQDGVPSLLFRVANERGNQVVEATMRLSMVRLEQTAEGESVRRIHDLKLQRAQTGVFVLSWLAIHPIDAQSPLHGSSLASLRAYGAEFVASLAGLDDTFGQTIHSRKAWGIDDLLVGRRFEDIMRVDEQGRRIMDLTRFHLTKQIPAAQAEAAAEAMPDRR